MDDSRGVQTASNSSTLVNFGLTAIVSFGLFAPPLHNLFGSSGAILVNAGLIMFSLMLLLVGHPRQTFAAWKRYLPWIAIFLLQTVSVCISLMNSTYELIPRDSFELHRPILNAAAFFLPLVIGEGKLTARALHNGLFWAWLIICIFGLFHYFRLNDFFLSLYVKENIIAQRRVSAPFVNPYDYGFIMLLFLGISLFYFFTKKPRIQVVLFFSVSAFMILSTQARGIFIAGIIAPFLALLFIPTFRRSDVIRGLTTLMGLGAILFVLLMMTFPTIKNLFNYLYSGINSMLIGNEVRSLSMRSEQLALVWEHAEFRPLKMLLGNGPSKIANIGVESIYAYYLFRYGIFGFIVGFFLPWKMFIFACFQAIEKSHSDNKPMMLGIIVWLLLIPVASITNNFTEQMRISFIFYFIAGIVFRLSQSNRQFTGPKERLC